MINYKVNHISFSFISIYPSLNLPTKIVYLFIYIRKVDLITEVSHQVSISLSIHQSTYIAGSFDNSSKHAKWTSKPTADQSRF